MYQTILQTDAKQPPEVRSRSSVETSDSIIDGATLDAIEADRLFDAVNGSETILGQAALYRSLVCPLRSRDAILEKQAALEELRTYQPLRDGVETLLKHAAGFEQHFYHLLYGTFLGMFGNPSHDLEFEGYGYEAYRKGTALMLRLVQDAGELPGVESPYLKRQIECIKGFASTRWYSLMQGPAYLTEQGFKTKQEKSRWLPAIVFKPSMIKPLFLVALVGLFLFFSMIAPLAAMGISSSVGPLLGIFLAPVVLLYMPMVGTFDRDSCIYRLRDDFKKSTEIQETLEAMARLDELLSFLRYGYACEGAVVAPEIIDVKRHSMSLSAAKNPILGKTDRGYVANDIDLDEARLTFITGPNSGGKTAMCKTVAQIQLLAQIGCSVPAETARLSVADGIFYQIPQFSSLDDGEGRFGTELKRTKEIFLASSSGSLVILDELSEGTTYEEKLETSGNVLEGFYRKDANTILITHNHELVDLFVNKKMGLPLQVEFRGDHPTYRLVSGISRVSHADRVAKKIGFSKQDIDDYFRGSSDRREIKKDSELEPHKD